MFIYCPHMYMAKYMGDFKDVLKNYSEMFEIYYSGDEKKTSELFYTKDFPDLFPFMVIIDTTKKRPINEKYSHLQVVDKEKQYYPLKYRDVIFFNKIQKDLGKFIEEFLDGEVFHFYQSEKMKQNTRVKKICAANFDKEVVKNPKVE